MDQQITYWAWSTSSASSVQCRSLFQSLTLVAIPLLGRHNAILAVRRTVSGTLRTYYGVRVFVKSSWRCRISLAHNEDCQSPRIGEIYWPCTWWRTTPQFIIILRWMFKLRACLPRSTVDGQRTCVLRLAAYISSLNAPTRMRYQSLTSKERNTLECDRLSQLKNDCEHFQSIHIE